MTAGENEGVYDGEDCGKDGVGYDDGGDDEFEDGIKMVVVLVERMLVGAYGKNQGVYDGGEDCGQDGVGYDDGGDDECEYGGEMK